MKAQVLPREWEMGFEQRASTSTAASQSEMALRGIREVSCWKSICCLLVNSSWHLFLPALKYDFFFLKPHIVFVCLLFGTMLYKEEICKNTSPESSTMGAEDCQLPRHVPSRADDH